MQDSIKPELDISQFACRYSLIHTATWTKGNSIDFEIDPWTLFLSNAAIKRKLDNYYLLQGSLQVKFVINGTPFTFGRAIAALNPYGHADRPTIAQDSANEADEAELQLCKLSQRPHVYLNPTTSTGGELDLPFVYPYNWLDISRSADVASMGRINLRSLGTLQTTTDDSSFLVTISVFARLKEGYRLAGATDAGVRSQAGEYQGGVVSGPCTAIARLSSKIAQLVPVLRPYALSTQMAARLAAGVARAFGYSRPVSVKDPCEYRPQYLGNMASCVGAETVAKLTCDPKQELTIDPKTLGIPSSEDQMTISYIAQKESYIGHFDWASGNAVGTKLTSINVNPNHTVYTTSSHEIALPAITFAAEPFAYWRGGIRFRFQIVASAYHKGRLRLAYDPGDNFAASGPSYPEVYSRVLDLDEDSDFTIDVYWQQGQAYKYVQHILAANPQPQSIFESGGAISNTFNAHSLFSNGQIGIYVQNRLVVPNPKFLAAVRINVFMAALPDFEVAEPTSNLIKKYSLSPPVSMINATVSQSGEIRQQGPTTIVEPIGHPGDYPEQNLVYMGESITSFRTLLKRYSYTHNMIGKPPAGSASFTPAFWRFIVNNFPLYFGRNKYGLSSVTSNNVTTRFNLNPTHLMTYLTPAFVTRRGGIRWKYVVTGLGQNDDGLMRIDKYGRQTLSSGLDSTLTPIYNPIGLRANLKGSAHYMRLQFGGMHGTYATPIRVNPTAEVEIPFYSNAKFVAASDVDTRSAYRHAVEITAKWSAGSEPNIAAFVAAGEDFDLGWFINAPSIYYQTIPVGV